MHFTKWKKWYLPIFYPFPHTKLFLLRVFKTWRCCTKTTGAGGRSPARPIFFPRINDSHCDMIHSSISLCHCFDEGYVEKKPEISTCYCVK